MSSHLLKIVALAVTVAGSSVALASPDRALAQVTPTQVIDAKADPDAAADALNSGCQDLSKCSWKNSGGFSDPAYGDPAILGDVLYNCSPTSYAETAIKVDDARENNTSVSEKVSLKISLKFIGLASSSAEFSAFSKQSESFSTGVSITNTVPVPPLYKGWTVTRIQTGTVTGSAYVTAGIDKLIQVSNIDLSFPGFRDPADTSDDPVLYTGKKMPMTAADITAACGNDTVKNARLLAAARATSKFKLGVCRGSGRCTFHKVAGSLPPRVRRATARLTRAGRTYGRGVYTGGQTRLDMRRPLKAGTYKLTLRERPAASQQTGAGALSAIETIVPITVGRPPIGSSSGTVEPTVPERWPGFREGPR